MIGFVFLLVYHDYSREFIPILITPIISSNLYHLEFFRIFKRNLQVWTLEEIRVEAADGQSRSRRTSIMSDSDYQTDAVDNAFKRALKKVAPNMQPLEEEESEASFTSSHRSEVSLSLFWWKLELIWLILAISTILSTIITRCISNFSNFGRLCTIKSVWGCIWGFN